MTKCDCCSGEDVFTCECCGNGLATERVPFVDTSGIGYDPNTEHAVWFCSDCKDNHA